MADYLLLLPGEKIIRQSTGVYFKSSMFSGYEDELVLTNSHLIHVDRGLIKVKSVRKIPLEQIIISQVQCEKNDEDDEHELLIPLKSGERLAFQFNDGKREIKKWVNEIHSTATDVYVEDSPRQKSSFTQGLAGMAIGFVKDILSIEDNPDYEDPVIPDAHFSSAAHRNPTFSDTQTKRTNTPPIRPQKITKKCIGCGAPLTGNVGQTITCEYCGIEQEL